MLKLKSSKSSKLVFDLTIEGVDASEVNPKFRIQYENVEYGFDAIIEKNQISVLLPPLNLVMPELKNKDILEARLDVVANGEFFSQPWTDKIEIHRPIQVKASVKEATVVEEEVKPTITVTPTKTVIHESKPERKQKKVLKKKQVVTENFSNMIDGIINKQR